MDYNPEYIMGEYNHPEGLYLNWYRWLYTQFIGHYNHPEDSQQKPTRIQWNEIQYWLVVTGTWLLFSVYLECHHPNWRTHIVQRGWKHQPVKHDDDKLHWHIWTTINRYNRYGKHDDILLIVEINDFQKYDDRNSAWPV